MRAAPCPVALTPARRSPHSVAVRMMAAGVMDAVSRVLARRWIDAIVLSAAIQTAATTLIIILGRMLSAGDSASAALNAIFLSLAAVATAFFGFLTGQVLDRKLPAFPLRSWIAINVLLGLLYGPLIGLGAMTPTESDANPWTSASLAAGYLIMGAIVNAVEGSVQALILRKVAYGAGTWVAYCALAGACWLLVIPDIAGIPRELTSTATGFLQILAMGLIVLPAMLRLRPRDRHTIPMLFE